MTNILDVPMTKNDVDAETVGEYLTCLLTALWSEGEGFSGKRPFGNSGWEYELYNSLVAAKIVPGEIHIYDDDPDHPEYDISEKGKKQANELIYDAINSLYD